MGDMKNKIKNFLLYAGLTREEYDQIQELYQGQNQLVLSIFSSLLCLAMGVFFCLSFLEEALSPGRFVYISVGLMMCVIVGVSLYGDGKNAKLFSFLSGVFVVVTYTMGIYNGTFGAKNHVCVTFMVLIIAIPMVFNKRPIEMFAELAISSSLFIFFAWEVKAENILLMDIADVITFSVASAVLNSYLTCMKAKGFFSQYTAMETQKKMEEALRQAETANQAKTTFLFNMSHDIRTPMNAIVGYTELMLKNNDDKEKYMDYLKKIRGASDFLLSLINNVLEMSHIESGKLALDESPIRAGQLTDEVLAVYSELMKRKHIEFVLNVDVHTEFIMADKVKLKEILLNLISNAHKYTPEGGKITVTRRELPCDKEGYTIIETVVSDTGIGMSKEFLPKIFEEFTREKNATENKIQGTGLGMPIVKCLVDLMGGTITVDSELGKGTTFTLTIPHKITDALAMGADADIATDTKQFEGKRILVAEDNELNAEIAAEILKGAGFLVEIAQDGVICVDMLQKAQADYYDLILMDIQMPNMDGYKTTQVIRAMEDPSKRNIPIVAMTANAFEEDKRKALAVGMNEHLAKPIRSKKLLDTLASILER